MKYLLLFCICLYSIISSAQNLVSNPSFADYVSCPTTISGIKDDKCTSWDSPNPASPDYFNSCNTGMVGVPANNFGYQQSHSGSYAGIMTYDEISPGGGYREYIVANIAPLLVGAEYRMTIYVSLADSACYATNGLGVYFYRNAAPGNSPSPAGTYTAIPYTPQVDYSDSGIIKDRLNWTKLTQTFVSDSAYTHLVIGCFKNTTDLNKIEYFSDSFVYGMAYYYIDSVSLEKISPASLTLLNHTAPISVYPDPVATAVTFKINNANPQSWNLQIFNSLGQLVYDTQCYQQELTLQRSQLNLLPGLYLYRIRSKDFGMYTGKFTTQ